MILLTIDNGIKNHLEMIIDNAKNDVYVKAINTFIQ